MSGAFAIGAVSMVLKRLLTLRVGGQDVSELGSVQFSALPLDRITTGANEPAQLNLFLYQVTHNAALRNNDLPARNAKGERVSNPALTLDLHYLLSAFGPDDLVAEALLGYGMQVFHEVPFLARQTIANTFSAADPTKPVEVAIAQSALAEQIEQIRICPHNLNTEEMSKLWTAFQSKMRPSVAYQVSVVWIDVNAPTRAPLPVLSRAPRADATMLPPFPTLESVAPPNNAPAAQVGDEVVLNGHHLLGTGVTTAVVRLSRISKSSVALADVNIAIPDSARSDKQVRFAAPDVPAGAYTVVVEVTPSGKPAEVRESNAMPLLVAPRITGGLGASVPLVGGAATINLACNPAVLPAQSASLVLGSQQFAANARNAATNALAFEVSGMSAGTYRVRLRVDGVDSLLVDRGDLNAPKFDETQQITLT